MSFEKIGSVGEFCFEILPNFKVASKIIKFF